MFDTTAEKIPARDHIAPVAAWLRQIHAALNRPIPHDLSSRHTDFARMVDREISRIRATSLDPRI